MVLGGCLRAPPSRFDEEKESHYLQGRRRVIAMDYQGAIESFERALEVNPRSGAAHLELACLLEQREADPAAAIYHYQQYLKLRPKADTADTVNQHITALKQELAKTVSLGPVTERQQHQLQLQADQIRHLNEEVEKWRSCATRLQALTNQAITAPAAPRTAKASAPMPATTLPANVTGSSSSTPGPVALAMQRTHTVKSRETAMTIARKYGVRLEALLAANPGLDTRRLHVGQTLNIPVASL
jgi:LysM repeat protein